METEALEITATAIALAKAGDMRAIESVLSRIAPAPRDRRLSLPNLPACDTAEGIATAQAMLIAEVAGGNLRPSEASALADLLELRRRSLETSTLEERIVALETKAKGNPL